MAGDVREWADGRWLTADGSSAGFRPIDFRLLFAAEAFERIGLAGEVLALLAVRADGVGGRDLLPFPAPEGGTEQSGPDDDAPLIGRGIADGKIDAAHAHGFFADFDDHFAIVRFIDDRVPRATAEDVGDVVETARPTTRIRWGRHERGQCSTSC